MMRKFIGKRGLTFLLAMVMICLPFAALSDDAGVLTEGELGDWVSRVLLESKNEQPQNAPVGEESRTEDGYAFLYSFATLYYDKPVLDEKSVLQGFSITKEAYDTPRMLRVGAPAEMLVNAYGWQNPMLLGDGSFAAFYVLNQLPEGAYWAWARRDGGQISAVQCAVHAKAGEGLYTDAGIEYQVEDGLISGIRVYGLSKTVTRPEVQGNLSAVYAVQAAISGDEPGMNFSTNVQGVTQKSEAAEFGTADLQFARIDFLTLTEAGAEAAFGKQLSEEWVQDDTGEWLHTTHRDGIALTHMLDKDKQNSRLETLSITKAGMEGPREITIGESLQSVLGRFRCEGTGTVFGDQALLYGDGVTPPYGTLSDGGDSITLRYVTMVNRPDGAQCEATLHLTFTNNQLAEIMVYSW